MKVDFDKPLSIDKSSFIEVWEKSGNAHVLMLRPHGFGKSMFTELLDNYYDHSKSSEFQKNYGNTYIAGHPTRNKSNYRVLRISFGNLRGCAIDKFREEFSKDVCEGIQNFMKKNPDLEYEMDENFVNAPDFLLTSLCLNFTQQFPGEKIFLIIEDYDNFAYDVLFENKTELCDVDMVRDFYNAIKSELNIVIGRTFITGVFPVSIGSLFDGMNSISNYSTYKNYHDIVGFNEEDLSQFLDDRISFHGRKAKASKNIKRSDKSKEQLLSELKTVAGGFVFSPHVSNSLYNSRNCEYYLHKEFSTGEDPLVKERARYFQRLNTLLDLSDLPNKPQLLRDICHERRIKINSINNFLRLTLVKNYQQDELLSLLFYLGFLTIDSNSIKTVGFAALVCPNMFVLDMFREYCRNKNIDIDYL